jgi:hypothetical protein
LASLAHEIGKAHSDVERRVCLAEEKMMSGEPEQNSELTERLSMAALERQGSEQHGTRFIRPWRMYAKEDHQLPESKELDACSVCGCGISPDVR